MILIAALESIMPAVITAHFALGLTIIGALYVGVLRDEVKDMNLKLFSLAVCLLIGSACAQDYGLNDLGSNLNSTELPRLDVPLQKLIDDASEGSSIRIPLGRYNLSEPLHINKNMTLVGSPFAYIDAQGTSQILQIDNPKASVTIKNFLLMHGSRDYGGAIASQAKSLTIRDCRFLDSSAECGAGIYQKGGNLQVMDSTFERNNASILGAAIYDEGGDMQVESSKFTQNSGSRVIYVKGAQPKQAQVLIKDLNVSYNPGPYNKRNTGFGGAIACSNSTTLIDHCTIKGNKALVMRPDFLGGITAGLDFAGSNVTLNDSTIEGNEALFAVAICIVGDSYAEINRCNIKRNHALRVLYQGNYLGGNDAGIAIQTGSKAVMNDVIVEGNLADGNSSAIGNSGIVNLNEGTIITRNTAKNHSAIENSEPGIINIHDGVHIFNNQDEHQPGRPIYSKGILNME